MAEYDYDHSSRFAAQRLDPEGFLAWVLPDFAEGWEFKGWLPTESIPFPGEADRRCDTVASFVPKSSDQAACAIVIEMQTYPTDFINDRGAEYQLIVRRTVLYQATPPLVRYEMGLVVVNLTGRPQRAKWRTGPKVKPPIGLQMTSRVVTLRVMDAVEHLDRIERGELSWCILPWISLMRGSNSQDVLTRWKSIAERVAPKEHWPSLRGIVGVFSWLTKSQSIWVTGLEGWTMIRSPAFDIYRNEGKAEGREEGLQAFRSTLRQLLERRFNTALPVDLAQLIQNQQELSTLSRWTNAVIDVESLDEFRQRMN